MTVENGTRFITINPADATASRLISELADAWVDMSTALNLSYGSRVHYMTVVNRIGDFLSDQGDRTLSIQSSGKRLTRRLYDWEAHMNTQFKPTSEMPRRDGERVRRLVRWHQKLNPESASDQALDNWAASTPLGGSASRSQPLDEFSNAERRSIEKACRDHVRRAEQQLKFGRELLAAGNDPQVDGFDSLANLVWAVKHLTITPELRAAFASTWDSDDNEIAEFLGPLTVDKRSRGTRAIKQIAALLLPGTRYLMAVRVLLHLRTGLSPEETRGLRRDEVQFEGQQVVIATTKLRAQRARNVFLEASDNPAHWGWKAGDLLYRAGEAMAFARELAPDQPGFWVSAKRFGTSIKVGQDFFTTYNLGDLVRDAGLHISEPHDLRRLRKTVKSVRAVVTGTMAGGAGSDHSVEVFRRHYAQTTTVHVIAARTVMEAQTSVLQRATEGPTLITALASDFAHAADSPVADLAAHVANESPIEQELTATACRNPLDSPFAAEGSLCHASPTLCLQCKNAVVFADHLPRLVAYRRVLRGHERSMQPIAFAEVYGQQQTNIDAILDRFPEAKVLEAEALFDSHGGQLHIPLGHRADLS